MKGISVDKSRWIQHLSSQQWRTMTWLQISRSLQACSRSLNPASWSPWFSSPFTQSSEANKLQATMLVTIITAASCNLQPCEATCVSDRLSHMRRRRMCWLLRWSSQDTDRKGESEEEQAMSQAGNQLLQPPWCEKEEETHDPKDSFLSFLSLSQKMTRPRGKW